MDHDNGYEGGLLENLLDHHMINITYSVESVSPVKMTAFCPSVVRCHLVRHRKKMTAPRRLFSTMTTAEHDEENVEEDEDSDFSTDDSAESADSANDEDRYSTDKEPMRKKPRKQSYYRYLAEYYDIPLEQVVETWILFNTQMTSLGFEDGLIMPTKRCTEFSMQVNNMDFKKTHVWEDETSVRMGWNYMYEVKIGIDPRKTTLLHTAALPNQLVTTMMIQGLGIITLKISQ